MKISAQLALLATLAGFSSVQAAAATQVSSSASFANVQIQLLDLNLNDGIAPSITFEYLSRVSAGVAPVFGEGLTSYSSTQSYGSAPQLIVGNGALGASTLASINGLQLNASGQVDGFGEYYGSAQKSLRFTLSPYTSLIVSGFASAGVSSELPLPDSASGSVSLQIINSQNASPFTQIAFYSNGAYSYNGQPTSVGDNFYLTFDNARASNMNGTIDMYAGAYGSVSPVPEPATYGMMLAGLALVGAAARRKRA